MKSYFALPLITLVILGAASAQAWDRGGDHEGYRPRGHWEHGRPVVIVERRRPFIIAHRECGPLGIFCRERPCPWRR